MKMSTVVRKSASLITPFLVTYGLYLSIYGHLSPGGGFQGGVILAVAVILLITSHGYHLVRDTFRVNVVKLLESTSALFIIAVSIIGLLSGSFMYNFLRGGELGDLFSGGTLVLFNIAIGLKVGAAFTLLFYVLLRWTESD